MNKDKSITFEGTMKEIETKYNRFMDMYENIEIMESTYLPVKEVVEIKETGKLGGAKHITQTSLTYYNKVVHYMETDETHIKRINKGPGTGVI